MRIEINGIKETFYAGNEIMMYNSIGKIENNVLHFNLHGWCFNRESVVRKYFFKTLFEYYRLRFNFNENSPEYKNYEYRIRQFATDAVPNTKISVHLGEEIFFTQTDIYGHFYQSLAIPVTQISPSYTFIVKYAQTYFEIKVWVCNGTKKISIISDIDDTIKDSNVLNKIELVRNSLYRDFKVVPKMNEFYDSIKDKCFFYYLSASPTQLYYPLFGFLYQYNFPYPENLRLKTLDASQPFNALNFLENNGEHKLKHIRKILDNDENDFILIGDNGELDPEIYNTIASEYPNRIKFIYIRKVSNRSLEEVFAETNKSKVHLFENGEDLQESFNKWNL